MGECGSGHGKLRAQAHADGCGLVGPRGSVPDRRSMGGQQGNGNAVGKRTGKAGQKRFVTGLPRYSSTGTIFSVYVLLAYKHPSVLKHT